MATQTKASNPEEIKYNGSNGTKKPNLQWRPTATKTSMDQFSERNGEENTLNLKSQMDYKSVLAQLSQTNSSKSTQNSLSQANIKLPNGVTNSDNFRNLLPIAAAEQETVPLSMGHGKYTSINKPNVGVSNAADYITQTKSKPPYTSWLPQMDGINIYVPSLFSATNQSSSDASTSTTDYGVKLDKEMLKTAQYINYVLNGRRNHKRLQVFEEIPLEEEDE